MNEALSTLGCVSSRFVAGGGHSPALSSLIDRKTGTARCRASSEVAAW